MKTSRAMLATVALLGLALGCQQKPGPPAADAEHGQAAPFTADESQQATATDAASSPAEVVSAFLAALRDGDEQTTAALLTDKARAETSKRDIVVRPPGDPTAQFEIGDVNYVDSQQLGAHVNSKWAENDEWGHRFAYEVVWALRRQADGWRVAGLATQVVDGEPPLFFNFEDPDDMIQKQRWAERIAAEQSQAPAARQVDQSRPGPAGTTIRR